MVVVIKSLYGNEDDVFTNGGNGEDSDGQYGGRNLESNPSHGAGKIWRSWIWRRRILWRWRMHLPLILVLVHSPYQHGSKKEGEGRGDIINLKGPGGDFGFLERKCNIWYLL